jgi:hypothetical protein
MALSEHEQRMLAEMERNLYENEADIVTTLGERRTLNHTAVAIGVIVALAGLITLLLGVYQDLTVVGILGFAILFTGVMVAVATPGKKKSESVTSEKSKTSTPSGGSFMDRLNERWDRRGGDNNQ